MEEEIRKDKRKYERDQMTNSKGNKKSIKKTKRKGKPHEMGKNQQKNINSSIHKKKIKFFFIIVEVFSAVFLLFSLEDFGSSLSSSSTILFYHCLLILFRVWPRETLWEIVWKIVEGKKGKGNTEKKQKEKQEEEDDVQGERRRERKREREIDSRWIWSLLTLHYCCCSGMNKILTAIFSHFPFRSGSGKLIQVNAHFHLSW